MALAALAAGGCAQLKPPEPAPAYFWIVHSRERSDSDRVIDQYRQPEKLLEFWDVRTGMRVAELGAGDGYFAELLARVVGAKGRVYAQVGHDEPERDAARLAARLKAPVMRNVVHVTRGFTDPLPPDARGLDFVAANFVYHARLRSPGERARMNRAVFAALKAGGVYAVTEHAGLPGRGADEAAADGSDAAVLRKEIEAAGFRFLDDAAFPGSGADPRAASMSRMAGRGGAFALKFVKP